MPTDILGLDGKTIIQESDAVFKAHDVLYLCEAKHNMTLKQVNKTFERIQKFKGFEMNAQAFNDSCLLYRIFSFSSRFNFIKWNFIVW
jgi:hypothetical protein